MRTKSISNALTRWTMVKSLCTKKQQAGAKTHHSREARATTSKSNWHSGKGVAVAGY
jgi:hypothetical protein